MLAYLQLKVSIIKLKKQKVYISQNCKSVTMLSKTWKIQKKYNYSNSKIDITYV